MNAKRVGNARRRDERRRAWNQRPARCRGARFPGVNRAIDERVCDFFHDAVVAVRIGGWTSGHLAKSRERSFGFLSLEFASRFAKPVRLGNCQIRYSQCSQRYRSVDCSALCLGGKPSDFESVYCLSWQRLDSSAWCILWQWPNSRRSPKPLNPSNFPLTLVTVR